MHTAYLNNNQQPLNSYNSTILDTVPIKLISKKLLK